MIELVVWAIQLLLMKEKYWPEGQVEPDVTVVGVVVVVVVVVGKVQPEVPKFASISCADPASALSKASRFSSNEWPSHTLSVILQMGRLGS